MAATSGSRARRAGPPEVAQPVQAAKMQGCPEFSPASWTRRTCRHRWVSRRMMKGGLLHCASALPGPSDIRDEVYDYRYEFLILPQLDRWTGTPIGQGFGSQLVHSGCHTSGAGQACSNVIAHSPVSGLRSEPASPDTPCPFRYRPEYLFSGLPARAFYISGDSRWNVVARNNDRRLCRGR